MDFTPPPVPQPEPPRQLFRAFDVYGAARWEIYCVAGDSPPVPEGLTLREIMQPGTTLTSHYLDAEALALIAIPAAPTPLHMWDWPTHTWLLPDGTMAVQIASVCTLIDAEYESRLDLPITYAASAFDAHAAARNDIAEALLPLLCGSGLPSGWPGWRDANNAMHWATDTAAAVQAQLAGLAAAISARKQVLQSHRWQLKADVSALTDIASVLAFDVTQGWPS
jgi:hypothetical protein